MPDRKESKWYCVQRTYQFTPYSFVTIITHWWKHWSMSWLLGMIDQLVEKEEVRMGTNKDDRLVAGRDEWWWNTWWYNRLIGYDSNDGSTKVGRCCDRWKVKVWPIYLIYFVIVIRLYQQQQQQQQPPHHHCMNYIPCRKVRIQLYFL